MADNRTDVSILTNKFDFAKHHHNYLSDYIKFADVKAVGIVSINSLILKVIFPFLNSKILLTITFLNITGTIGLLIGVIFAVLVLFPRTNDKSSKGLIFWENVSAYNKDDYINDVKNISEEKLLERMIEQNFFLAKVATKKYAILKKSFIFTSFGFFVLIVSAVFWLFS